jgi:hypothetical protein
MSRHKHEPTLEIFRPIGKGHICDMALPSANTPWLSRNIRPKHTPSAIRITTSISVSGVLKAIITRKGVTIITDLNMGNSLVPGAMYVFEVMLHHHDSINFTYDTTNGTNDTTNGIIQFARFEEIDASSASGRAGSNFIT